MKGDFIMKLYARVTLKTEENAIGIIRALYKESNDQIKLVLTGKKLEIEATSETLEKTIQAISFCQIEELRVIDEEYVNLLAEHEDKKNTSKTELDIPNEGSLKETRAEDVNNTNVNDTGTKLKRVKIKAKKTSAFKQQVKSSKKAEIGELTELLKLADKANSFDEFSTLVAKWLELDQKLYEYFKMLTKRVNEIDKVNWFNLEAQKCSSKEIKCREYIRAKLGYSWTTLKLLKEMAKYKGSFNKEVKPEITETTQQIEDDANVQDNCVSENPWIKEIFPNIDKTKPVEERISYVLTEMGIDKYSRDTKNVLLSVINVAVKIKDMTEAKIFTRVKNSDATPITFQVVLSKLINDYTDKFGKHKAIKSWDFLKELQENIMNEEEII